MPTAGGCFRKLPPDACSEIRLIIRALHQRPLLSRRWFWRPQLMFFPGLPVVASALTRIIGSEMLRDDLLTSPDIYDTHRTRLCGVFVVLIGSCRQDLR